MIGELPFLKPVNCKPIGARLWVQALARSKQLFRSLTGDGCGVGVGLCEKINSPKRLDYDHANQQYERRREKKVYLH